MSKLAKADANYQEAQENWDISNRLFYGYQLNVADINYPKKLSWLDAAFYNTLECLFYTL